MYTTATFQIKPDFYSTKEECAESRKQCNQTNPRYKNFCQTHFTVGDEEQFETYRDATNGDIYISKILMTNNLFATKSLQIWDKYKDVGADAVINTFRYIFHKFKKGIFVKIMNNKLRVFLPFSKVNYYNEWSDRINIDGSKYKSIKEFIRILTQKEGYTFNDRSVNSNIDEWYGNNCLVRYEYPLSECDTNVGSIKNMLDELCSKRELPDIEFFINKRDFPLLTKDATEPYNNIWDTTEQPLVSHLYSKYIPIMSMSVSQKYADIPLPTCDDWARVQSFSNKWFPKLCRDYSDNFDTEWDNKIPTAVFRGSSTGCGVTVKTNQRLNLVNISRTTPNDKDGVPYLDAGITKWNLRPRKIQGEKYLKYIDIDNLGFGLSSPLSPQQQSKYKYIINIDGHVTAFRLSLELGMGSVVLLVQSSWYIWYSSLLVPYKHYVPVKADLSDLITQIKWCKLNDNICFQITQNAKQFYKDFLQKDGILDYMQNTLVTLKNNMGIYLYNTKPPLDTMIDMEYKALDFYYPNIDKNISNIYYVPRMKRSYSMLSGIEWLVRKIIKESNFENVALENKEIFKNKLGNIRRFSIANFSVVVKTTSDLNKINEHIHEAFIGTKSINNLLKHIPNFVYTLGLYKKDNTFNVVNEYISGQSLFDYINSDSFNFSNFFIYHNTNMPSNTSSSKSNWISSL